MVLNKTVGGTMMAPDGQQSIRIRAHRRYILFCLLLVSGVCQVLRTHSDFFAAARLDSVYVLSRSQSVMSNTWLVITEYPFSALTGVSNSTISVITAKA